MFTTFVNLLILQQVSMLLISYIPVQMRHKKGQDCNSSYVNDRL